MKIRVPEFLGPRLAPTADVGRNVANIDIADREIVLRVTALRIPAAQNMLDRRIRIVCVVGFVCMVHRHHVRHLAGSVPAGIVRGDAHPLRTFDDESGVADKSNADLIGREFGCPVCNRYDAGEAFRHRQTFARHRCSL